MIRYTEFLEDDGMNPYRKQGRFFQNTDISNEYITNNFYSDHRTDKSDLQKLDDFIYKTQKYGMDLKINPESNLAIFLFTYDRLRQL